MRRDGFPGGLRDRRTGEVGEVREVGDGSANAPNAAGDRSDSSLPCPLSGLFGLLPADRAVERLAEQLIDEPRHRHAPFTGLVIQAGDNKTVDYG